MKTAILQVADTGPLESLVVMLRSVGYECYIPDKDLRRELRAAGCGTVLDIADLVRGMGYEKPFAIPEAAPIEMFNTDLYVDIKAHRNGPLVWKKWPRLKSRTLWYRINGGKPEHVVNARGDHGDEVNPPCPILTPNMWYVGHGDKAYACWPPFYRADEYDVPRANAEPGIKSVKYDPPICLIHNLTGWGYGALIERVREMGVRCHGDGSPDGLINHSHVRVRLSSALCMVHLKSSDAPGYALYEALAAGCPVVCTRRLIWRNRMESLLIPGKTCLVFDRETHDALSPEDVIECTRELKVHLASLSDRAYNVEIGEAGRERLHEVMWSEKRDSASLDEFMKRNFG